MSNQSNQAPRDGRVVLAWIILALQIIGLLWLLLFARDRLAALTGGDRAGGHRTGRHGTRANRRSHNRTHADRSAPSHHRANRRTNG